MSPGNRTRRTGMPALAGHRHCPDSERHHEPDHARPHIMPAWQFSGECSGGRRAAGRVSRRRNPPLQHGLSLVGLDPAPCSNRRFDGFLPMTCLSVTATTAGKRAERKGDEAWRTVPARSGRTQKLYRQPGSTTSRCGPQVGTQPQFREKEAAGQLSLS